MTRTNWTHITDVDVAECYSTDRQVKATLYLSEPPTFRATPWVVAVAKRNPKTNRMVGVGGSVHESFDSAKRAFDQLIDPEVDERMAERMADLICAEDEFTLDDAQAMELSDLRAAYRNPAIYAEVRQRHAN